MMHNYLAVGWADAVAGGEALAAIWKLLASWGSQPGTWLVAGGLAIALVMLWRAPKIAEVDGDDKVDAQHPAAQIVLRLISNFPRMMLSFMALGALTFGILDLTGTVPLREKRADIKVEAKHAQPGTIIPRRDTSKDERGGG